MARTNQEDLKQNKCPFASFSPHSGCEDINAENFQKGRFQPEPERNDLTKQSSEPNIWGMFQPFQVVRLDSLNGTTFHTHILGVIVYKLY